MARIRAWTFSKTILSKCSWDKNHRQVKTRTQIERASRLVAAASQATVQVAATIMSTCNNNKSITVSISQTSFRMASISKLEGIIKWMRVAIRAIKLDRIIATARKSWLNQRWSRRGTRPKIRWGPQVRVTLPLTILYISINRIVPMACSPAPRRTCLKISLTYTNYTWTTFQVGRILSRALSNRWPRTKWPWATLSSTRA